MTSDKKLTVSASPHVRSGVTSSGIMLDVIIALIPALIASVVIFGVRTLAVTAISVAGCVLSEYLARKAMKRPNTVGDLSAAVTGILLAFNLPPSIPFWMVIVGDVVAIVVVKQMFGGIGQNFVNPALIGRIVLFISFPDAMTAWVQPRVLSQETVDALTTATPLAAIFEKGELEQVSLVEMFFGIRMGCLGEVCAVALILGGIYLFIRRVISPIIPLCYIGTTALLIAIMFGFDRDVVLRQIMGGGLLLGAIFMATDYSTSPISRKGKVIFAVGCGVMTALIRLFGNMAEGVSFSIILMNILVPHIERLTVAVPFGTPKGEKKRLKAEAKAEKAAEKFAVAQPAPQPAPQEKKVPVKSNGKGGKKR